MEINVNKYQFEIKFEMILKKSIEIELKRLTVNEIGNVNGIKWMHEIWNWFCNEIGTFVVIL